MKTYWIYFMQSQNDNALYVGVTNDLMRRVLEHKLKRSSVAFTDRYNCTKLVYFEEYRNINDAINREKNIKNWKRVWKDELINSVNPTRADLSSDWYL